MSHQPIIERTPGGGARVANPPALRQLLIRYAARMGWPHAGKVVKGGMNAWIAFARDKGNDLERIAAALLWLDDLANEARQSNGRKSA